MGKKAIEEAESSWNPAREFPLYKVKLVYHYTIGGNFKRILASGVILPATAGVLPPERPIVWFSTNSFWQNSVVKGIPVAGGRYVDMGWAELNRYEIPPIRIGVALETAPLRWRDLREQSLMPAAIASGLVRAAKKQYAQSGEWRGTFEAVPAEKWVSVEKYNADSMHWETYNARVTGSEKQNTESTRLPWIAPHLELDNA